MAYAILRTKKLTTGGQIAGAGAHMMRTRETPNADPERIDLNRILVGSASPTQDVEQRLQVAYAEAEPVRTRWGGTRPWKPTKASVKAIEIFVGFSPDWQGNINDWSQRSHQWLGEYFGADNLVHLQLHADETTPHLTGLVVPVDPDTKRLNAKRWLGGREKMSALQDSHWEAVREMGLDRGIKGSKARHQEVQRWYAIMESPLPEPFSFAIDPKRQTQGFFKRQESDEAHAERESRRLNDLAEPILEDLRVHAQFGHGSASRIKELQASVHDKEQELAHTKSSLSSMARERYLDKEEVDRLRKALKGVPMEEVFNHYRNYGQLRKPLAHSDTYAVKTTKKGAEVLVQDGQVIARDNIAIVHHLTGLSHQEAMVTLAHDLPDALLSGPTGQGMLQNAVKNFIASHERPPNQPVAAAKPENPSPKRDWGMGR